MRAVKAVGPIVIAIALLNCGKAPETPVVTVAAGDFASLRDMPASDKGATGCPAGMVEVEGDYCPNAQEVCLHWVDAHGVESEAAKPSKKFPTSRCGEWAYPTKCLSAHMVHKHYCIDTYEYPNHKGERPQTWMNWYDVKNACEAQGKRLCTKEEWTFACEGPDMQPYPYKGHGTHPGYSRDKTACNFDNPVPHEIRDILKVSRPDQPEAIILQNLLVPSGDMPDCVSPFGVYDMVGNADEFVNNTAIPEHSPSAPYRSGLMSGHVFGVRNQCRAITDGHNEWFGWYETSGRCCDDVESH
jgi:hypothetical protein